MKRWLRAVGEWFDARLGFRESLLQYHRPLLEDGEIEYEFFYEPGKAEVHPALDRLVFLLDPKEAKIHWLTDAQFDRTGRGLRVREAARWIVPAMDALVTDHIV